MQNKVVFKRSLTNLKTGFPSPRQGAIYTKIKGTDLSFYSLIDGGRVIRFIPFPTAIV